MPTGGILFCITGPSKRVIVADQLAQIGQRFGFLRIVEEGLSHPVLAGGPVELVGRHLTRSGRNRLQLLAGPIESRVDVGGSVQRILRHCYRGDLNSKLLGVGCQFGEPLFRPLHESFVSSFCSFH
jgi:hypothetical protein